MKYFTLKELSRSNVAETLGIENTPQGDSVYNLKQLVNNVLDPARAFIGGPITVTSGYRSRELNRIIGGAVASQHCTGHAADITCNAKKIQLLYHYIANYLKFDQLIYYVDRNFIHVSYVSHRKNRQRIIVKCSTIHGLL